MSSLGELIRTAREKREWTLSELGRRARINPATIGRIEDGTTRFVKAPTVRAIAAALGLDWDAVLEVAPHLKYETVGAPEVALAGASGFPGSASGGASAPLDRGGVGAADRDDRLSRAEFDAFREKLASVLSDAFGRPVNLSCRSIDAVLRPAWRGLPGPVGAGAWNPEAAGVAPRLCPSGCQQRSRLSSLSGPAIRATVGASSPSRPGATLTRRYGSRA